MAKKIFDIRDDAFRFGKRQPIPSTREERMKPLATKEVTELRRLDRKITSGKATRREVERGIELKRRKGAATALSR